MFHTHISGIMIICLILCCPPHFLVDEQPWPDLHSTRLPKVCCGIWHRDFTMNPVNYVVGPLWIVEWIENWRPNQHHKLTQLLKHSKTISIRENYAAERSHVWGGQDVLQHCLATCCENEHNYCFEGCHRQPRGEPLPTNMIKPLYTVGIKVYSR